jgi:hypothetical protein
MSTCTSLFVPLKAAGSRDIALFVAQASQKVQCQVDTDVSNARGPWFESHDRTFSRFFFPHQTITTIDPCTDPRPSPNV